MKENEDHGLSLYTIAMTSASALLHMCLTQGELEARMIGVGNITMTFVIEYRVDERKSVKITSG